MTDYLDAEDILLLHRQMHKCDGFSCVRDLGRIESAAARPQTLIFGHDPYPDIWSKAAALLHSIAADHPFVDGNKRTAWHCAWSFLGLNGHVLPRGFDVDAAEDFMLGVVTDSLEVADIAAGLRKFSGPGD
jgi:death-on-curing protein